MSNLSIEYTHNPIVKRETAKLIEYVWVNGKRIAIPFEREIVWLRAFSSEFWFSHGGKMIDDKIRFLGLDIFDEVKGAMNSFKITAESTLIVKVELSVTDRPRFVAPKEKYGGPTPRYQCGMELIRDGQQGIVKPSDDAPREVWETWSNTMESFVVKEIEVERNLIWTSKEPLEKLKKRLADYRKNVEEEAGRLAKEAEPKVAEPK